MSGAIGMICSFIPDSVRQIPFDFVKREFIYLFMQESRVRALNEQTQKLKDARRRVETELQSAMRDGQELHDDVRKWLHGVDQMISADKAEELEEARERAQARCFVGLCPNLTSRRQLGKKAEADAAVVAQLLKEYSEAQIFKGSVSYRPALQGTIGGAPDQDFEAFESRANIFEGITKALKDPSLARVGVHGMPGIGKTMLVKQVQWSAREERIFHEVALATVTSNPDTRRIQGEIADALGLTFKRETVAGRATELSHRLNNGQRILIILDDIWEELPLRDIGIIFEDKMQIDGRGDETEVPTCKLLMTSRSQDVLGKMKSNNNFEVTILPFQEAELLFTKIVGSVAEEHNYKLIANEVIEKCAGSPVAIAAVAKALRNSTSTDVWQDVQHKLRNSRADKIDGVEQSVYSALELSYHMLRDSEAQQLFLLCGLYEQGANISISYLLKYSLGLELFDGVGTLDEARIRVNALLHKLKASSLLLKGDSDDTVKLHDLVREVAISIANRDPYNMFVIEDETHFKRLSKKGKLGYSTRIAFPFSGNHELPDKLECPKLELLMLFNNYPYLIVPDHFFQQMTELKVLDLTCMANLSALPTSFLSVMSLQTLCLDWCSGMRDISFIGKLHQLGILSFRGSDIEELPGDMKQLRQLMLLDLSDCSKLKVIPANVISSLTRLEELYMGNSFNQWGVKDNASLSELHNLSSHGFTHPYSTS